ncbi:hypothetical protein [Amnibacterium flavum]|uniref:Uncharacterized protein n=1 Tax=Amnibacterium flavum TaxID=2173173 RepID=A0A2V1HXQ6_9MICO|nr:hypothetical protein [Amnibacterium flavum]PVZ95134.1 hypothetical protein DDQ50_00965 [Amnibacterium flavum]
MLTVPTLAALGLSGIAVALAIPSRLGLLSALALLTAAIGFLMCLPTPMGDAGMAAVASVLAATAGASVAGAVFAGARRRSRRVVAGYLFVTLDLVLMGAMMLTAGHTRGAHHGAGVAAAVTAIAALAIAARVVDARQRGARSVREPACSACMFTGMGLAGVLS